MTELMNEMTQKMMSEMQEKKEAFIKEMIDAQHTTKEKANAAAMNLLRILDAWVAGIESSAITYEFTATWPEGKNATEEE